MHGNGGRAGAAAAERDRLLRREILFADSTFIGVASRASLVMEKVLCESSAINFVGARTAKEH